MTYPPFLASMGNPTGTWTIPMISSSYTLAACVTSPFVATFAFYVGRRGCMIIGCIAVIIGAVVQAASYSVAQIIVGRLITGESRVQIDVYYPATKRSVYRIWRWQYQLLCSVLSSRNGYSSKFSRACWGCEWYAAHRRCTTCLLDRWGMPRLWNLEYTG